MLQVAHVCSFGTLCHTAQIFKRNSLKKISYPFDWIFSSCDTIIDCLDTEFKIFLDKTYYNNIGEKQCGHSKYGISIYNNLMFNHHNPLINEDDYCYYKRCIERFNDLLKKQEHKLFVITLVNIKNIDENEINKIIDFNNKFSKYTSDYTLLVIFHVPNKDKNHHIFTFNNNIDFLELHTLSESSGVEFFNSNDNNYLDTIIKSKYNFNI